jgi:hypothetical protein
LATHGGIPAVARAAWRRLVLGGTPDSTNPLVEEHALDPQRGGACSERPPQSRFRSGSAGGLHDDAGQSWCRLSRLPQGVVKDRVDAAVVPPAGLLDEHHPPLALSRSASATQSSVAASHAERARLNVTRAIRAAVANLARDNPALGRHLAATIRTGRYCAYLPDPRAPIAWEC